MRGVVTTSSFVVGEAIVASWPLSSLGIQIVYVSAVVRCVTRSTPISKRP
jgi:hypothetical protein